MRLEKELNVIKEMGFADYFLIVYDYVKFAKMNNILVGPGRGSVSGSIVAYLLGVTKIDSIKYDLLFERFTSVHRKGSIPDIDADAMSSRREELFNYVIDIIDMYYRMCNIS